MSQPNPVTKYHHLKKLVQTFSKLEFNNTTTVNSIISKVNFRLTVLNEIFQHSNIRTKLMLTNSIIVRIGTAYCITLTIDDNMIIKKVMAKIWFLHFLCDI